MSLKLRATFLLRMQKIASELEETLQTPQKMQCQSQHIAGLFPEAGTPEIGKQGSQGYSSEQTR